VRPARRPPQTTAAFRPCGRRAPLARGGRPGGRRRRGTETD